MRRVRLALVPLAIALGVGAEWASYGGGTFELVVADFAVGCVLMGCGLLAWDRRPESRVGVLMTVASLTWYLGNFGGLALYLHRGPLVHLHLSYPDGRLATRAARAAVAAAYVYALVEPLGHNDAVTVVLAGVVALAATNLFVRTSGPARKAGAPALAAALAFAAVLAAGAVDRIGSWGADRAVLWSYDVVIACIAVVLLVDLLRGRWVDAVVSGLVVDLGAPHEAGTLRAKLAGSLGDPSLFLAYRLPGADAYVDEAGRQVELPPPGSGRAVTTIDDGGAPIAVLVHDDGLLADRRLLDAVAAATRMAVGNARLQAELRSRALELEASRRRIVEAADEQRRRLEQELRLGAEQRLERVLGLLAGSRATAGQEDAQAITALEADLAGARRELREFAGGVYPALSNGLMPALTQLARRSPTPVELEGAPEGLPDRVEAAAFFVCSEALANVAKHAHASHVSIRVRATGGSLVATVSDDGVGGAGMAAGSGLRGLADRVEALGGSLSVASPPGGGTRVDVEIPLD